MDKLEERFDKMDARFDKIDDRFARIDERFDGLVYHESEHEKIENQRYLSLSDAVFNIKGNLEGEARAFHIAGFFKNQAGFGDQ
jgi:hypothetical protein